MRNDLLTNGKTSKSPENSMPHFGWTPRSNTAARDIYDKLTGAGVGNNYADIVRRLVLTADEYPEQVKLICDAAFEGKPFPYNGVVAPVDVELEVETDSEEDVSELEGVDMSEDEMEPWNILAALTKAERKGIRKLAR